MMLATGGITRLWKSRPLSCAVNGFRFIFCVRFSGSFTCTRDVESGSIMTFRDDVRSSEFASVFACTDSGTDMGLRFPDLSGMFGL